MNNYPTPPHHRSTDQNQPPVVPRRLLNDRLYLEHTDDMPEAPIMASRKMTVRYHTMSQILVNDAGMVRDPAIKGSTF